MKPYWKAAHEQEKQAVFRITVSGSHHILLNYLNQMQLVTMEAAAALMKLEAVERVTAGDHRKRRV